MKLGALLLLLHISWPACNDGQAMLPTACQCTCSGHVITWMQVRLQAAHDIISACWHPLSVQSATVVVQDLYTQCGVLITFMAWHAHSKPSTTLLSSDHPIYIIGQNLHAHCDNQTRSADIGFWFGQVTSPLSGLSRLPELQIVDLRGIHAEVGLSYWSEKKCASMRHLTTFAKALKRRNRPGKIFMDYD